MKNRLASLAVLAALMASAVANDSPRLPTLFIVGDSTVKNGTKDQQGWGDPIAAFFDKARIKVENHAIGGRSSRTFQTEGRWDKILDAARPGDFVLIQMGHNDGGPLDDSRRARGTLKGTGDETREIDNPLTGKKEVVRTYGWYLRKYIADARAKGAMPIVCTLIPRNLWDGERVARPKNSHADWAREVAKAEGVPLVDLHEAIAQRYDQMGKPAVDPLFADERVHTTAAGAELNAACVISALQALPEDPLAAFLRPRPAATW